MNSFYSFTRSSLIRTLYVCSILCVLFTARANAQVTVTSGYTATQLAAKLTGTGVTVFGATLTCPTGASGEFKVVSSSLGIDSGIVLTNGQAVTGGGTIGVNIIDGSIPSGDFADNPDGAPGDASLTALAGLPTFDACVLEFNFKPAGDTVSFKYVFGSEEYTSFTCTEFNDVFGFLISGGAYSTPTNLAIVPGTSIPVCINSVNCGPTGGGTLATCTALGTGSPFCAYFVNNAASTTSFITYDGLTTVLTAKALVNPCDTYHLKMGVADASDDALDSGVFIEAGSLSSPTPTNVTATGTSGLPYCIRGCAPGDFIFTTPVAQDTPIVIHYIITGSAVNGYDYSTIPDSVIIPPFTTSTVLNINTLPVTPAGPKVITLEIEVHNPCDTGSSIGAIANLTILDSFNFHIVTPDTSICDGQSVHIIAVGDSLFDSILHYTWTPGGTLNNDTILTPIATPTVTTTYTLTGTTASVLGCAPQSETIIITVDHALLDSVTITNPSYCGASDGTLTLWGLETGLQDTLFYTDNGVPVGPIPVVVSPAHTVTITGLSSSTASSVFTNIFVKVGICKTLALGPITLTNPPPPVVTVDSPLVKTCIGIPVQLHAYATPAGPTYFYSWSPATYLSNAAISNPVVDPLTAGDITYVVTANPSTNPICAGTATVTVHTLPNDFTLNNHDTAICIGESVVVNITGSSEFSWLWTPPAGVSDTTAMDPVITPTTTTSYTVTANYAHCPEMVHSFNIEVDHPAPVLSFTDTVCLGMTYNVDVTVPGSTGSGSGYYHYQWTPAGDMSNDTIPNPVITPVVTGPHVYSVTVQPHAVGCAVTDIVNLQVYPNTINLMTPDTAICIGQTVKVLATGDPIFSYQWVPTAGIPVSDVVAPLITPDTSATYVVTASFHKCPDIHDTLRIDVQPYPSIYIADRAVCQYDTIHILPSVTPEWYSHYSYTWTPATYLDNTTANNVVFTGMDTGQYKIYLTVSSPAPANCSSSDSALITVHPGNFATLSNDTDVCPRDSIQRTATGGVAYSWHPSMYLDDSTTASPWIKAITSQTYTVVATSQYGCLDTLNVRVTVHPSAVLYLGDSATIYPGETYQIATETNCTSFQWFPPAGLSNANIPNPIASPEVNTKYILYGSTEWGCKAVDSIDIYVSDETILAVPNAFTPGSGANNEFKIIKRGIATLNYFRIFNRWGNLVFETTDIDKGWDGSYKGTPQPFGVYVYQIEAVSSNGKIFSKHGNITLLR